MGLRLHTEIVPAGPAAAIVLSDADVDALGDGRRAAVRVTIGGVTERLRVAVMGGQIMIGLRRDVRERFGVAAGDVVDVQIDLDDAPREVTVPGDLAAALAAAGVRSAFDAQTYTRRKEAAASVTDAKRPETRARRIAAVVAGLVDA